VHGDHVAKAHSEVAADDLVNADLHVVEVIPLFDGKRNANSVLALLSLEHDSVVLEYLELLHLGLRHFNDRVVVVLGLLDCELVRGLLLF
jgi:hypothetical protein